MFLSVKIMFGGIWIVVNAVNAKDIILNQMIRKEWKEFTELCSKE